MGSEAAGNNANSTASTITPTESSPPTDLGVRDKPALLEDIDPANEAKGLQLYLIFTGICFCTFLVALDLTLIATAIPVITSQFDSISDVGWYGSSFYISLCATQLLAGKMYMLFPKRTVYLLYLALFEVGSLVCALAPSSATLIGGRAIAGFGASGLFAGGFILLTTIIPLSRRAIWTGVMSSTFAISSIIGPVIGGAITQDVTWRWCFYLNLPIGGAGAVLIFFCFRVNRAATEDAPLAQKFKGLDFVGFALFAGSITMLLLALQFGGSNIYPWRSSQVIGLFVGFGVTLAVFIPWQLYMKDSALVPPQFFQNRNATLIFSSSLFVNGPFQTIIYWLPIWFQAVLGVSPSASGVRYLPTVISDALASVIGAGIVMQLGYWTPFLWFAEAMVCIGGGLLTTIYPGISDGHWIGYQIFGGIGYSLASNLAHLGLQASLPPEIVPVGSAVLLFGISTSCAVFLSIGQAVFASRLYVDLANNVDPTVINAVISAGATEVRNVVSAMDLPAVLQAYSDAVTQVFYIPAAAPVISFFLLLGCKWTSVKAHKNQEKEAQSDEEKPENV